MTAITKLTQLSNAGILVTILSPNPGYYRQEWVVRLEKSENGAKLEITKEHLDPEEAIAAAYDAWIGATRSLPSHNLKQIEYAADSGETPL